MTGKTVTVPISRIWTRTEKAQSASKPKLVLPIIAMPVWSVSVPWISLWAENTYGGNRHGLECQLCKSYGRTRPNERYLDFQLKKQEFDMDLSDERQPLATPRTGSTLTLSDKFSLKEL